jgi:nitrite reductase (NADH) small subunit
MAKGAKKESEANSQEAADEMHAPGEAGAAKKEPIPNATDTAEVAKEPKEHVVGDVSDFPVKSHKVVKVGGRQIGIFNINGRFYGLPNVCPHQTGPLCESKILTGTLIAREDTDWKHEWVHDGEVIACPWHGLEYHVPTGQCLAYPKIRLRHYEVIVEENKVKVRV